MYQEKIPKWVHSGALGFFSASVTTLIMCEYDNSRKDNILNELLQTEANEPYLRKWDEYSRQIKSTGAVLQVLYMLGAMGVWGTFAWVRSNTSRPTEATGNFTSSI